MQAVEQVMGMMGQANQQGIRLPALDRALFDLIRALMWLERQQGGFGGGLGDVGGFMGHHHHRHHHHHGNAGAFGAGAVGALTGSNPQPRGGSSVDTSRPEEHHRHHHRHHHGFGAGLGDLLQHLEHHHKHHHHGQSALASTGTSVGSTPTAKPANNTVATAVGVGQQPRPSVSTAVGPGGVLVRQGKGPSGSREASTGKSPSHATAGQAKKCKPAGQSANRTSAHTGSAGKPSGHSASSVTKCKPPAHSSSKPAGGHAKGSKSK